MPQLRVPTRRERQREATYDEIVSASRDLLADGAELSLRAVAGRMGLTAPALYRTGLRRAAGCEARSWAFRWRSRSWC